MVLVYTLKINYKSGISETIKVLEYEVKTIEGIITSITITYFGDKVGNVYKQKIPYFGVGNIESVYQTNIEEVEERE